MLAVDLFLRRAQHSPAMQAWVLEEFFDCYGPDQDIHFSQHWDVARLVRIRPRKHHRPNPDLDAVVCQLNLRGQK